MVENFKNFFMDQASKNLFFGPFRLNLGLVLIWDNLLTLSYELGHLVCKELFKLGSSRKSFSDESFNSHVHPNKTRVFSLDYVFRDLETSGDGLEAEDDVRSSKLAITMEKYLRFQDSIELIEIHQASSLGGGLLI